eukprot:TRINITY_DN13900_c0_g1_i1.p1 TRINITY_DN13900_c0_g1~~TRINITY_DN13900_c0_g1_i1.p1  ORF type:complete len:640 (+),score=101.72 TRINITY_DN13900_c0_g1_i1:88-2007(+)
MATMLPMRGTSEMEVFAAKQLKKRVPELNEAFRTAGQEVQAKLRPEFTAVMQAVVKHDKNPEDCPLMSGDLLRVVMTLKNKIERNKAITMSPQHVAAKKPSLESSSSTKRELPVGSRGPHPLVTAALRKKQKRKRDKDSDTEEAEEEDEAEEEAEVEVEVVPEPAPRETPKEEIKCKSKPLQPPEEPPPDDTPAIKIPKIEEVNEVKIETPKESPAHPPHPSPGSSPASFAIPVLPVCNMRIRGAQVTAPSVDGYPGRFDVQNEKGWKQFLQVHGWVIVGPVATVTEIEQMKNNFWEYREAMGTNINRNIPETWSNDAWGGNYNTGFWCSHGAGQEQWMWDLREKCYPVFKTLYRTDELFTSFEGFSACRKSTPVKPGIWKIDQDPKELKFQCFQGAMSLLDSGPYDAGLCVGDGSRRSFQQFAELKDKSTKVIPSQHQYDLIQNPLKLCYKKGDLILWDSRVATCLQPSSDTSQPDLASLHGCVCMVPLASATRSNPDPSRLTAQQKAWRRQCIEEGRTTTHHVWLNQTEKISSSRRTGLPIMSLASYTPPKLSDLQIRMAGIYCRSEGRPRPNYIELILETFVLKNQRKSDQNSQLDVQHPSTLSVMSSVVMFNFRTFWGLQIKKGSMQFTKGSARC